MDIYDVLDEARYGDVEAATKTLIEFLSEEIMNNPKLSLDSVYDSIANKLINDPSLFTEEELKKIAVIDFVYKFIRDHKVEIERSYNLLPLTNDPDIKNAITDMRNSEIKDASVSAVGRFIPKIEPDIKIQTLSRIDKILAKYIKDLTVSIKEKEENIQKGILDKWTKEDLLNDEANLKVLSTFAQNTVGLNDSVSVATLDEAKWVLGNENFFDAHLPEGEFEKRIDKEIAGVKISIEDVETQLEGDHAWAKVTSKVPSDEIYELMDKVLAKKNKPTI